MELFSFNTLPVAWLNRLANSSPLAVNFVIFGAVYLGWVMLAALLLYIYHARKRFKAVVISFFAVFSGLLALFASDLIKDIYPLSRPFSDIKGIIPLFRPGDWSAFPSGHAAFFGGVAFYLYFHLRKKALSFIIAAFLVGVARVASGVHFPLDILAGWGLAFVAARALYWLDKKWL